MYEPGLLSARLISPVAVLTKMSPAGAELKVPPGAATVGIGFVALLQNDVMA